MQHIEVCGLSVPAFFYGTAWKEERTQELTELAIASGFRAIDTANQRRHYVEAAVGQALQSALALGAVARDEIFLQTKYTYTRGQDHRLPYDPAAPYADQVEQSFASSLEHLQTGYLDSYVLHGPCSAHGLTDVDWEVWRAMEKLRQGGKARLLGVSNVSADQLALLLRDAEVKPAFVQNRCFAARGWDREVRALCREHGVVYQAFSLLTANQRELSKPAVARIVESTGRRLPEVVFRFAIQLGMIPLTGTSNAEHMRQDLSCFDFELTDDELSALETVAG
jgi:diketogulonate reductase-like aldo/keto reductase